ncbi:hypothetical protein C8R45DRAFT_973647 [Mycena sanguinolenta]|nr:hypothetical protein C8R45DRAFT_973647 [Mycena sanguinolenta]
MSRCSARGTLSIASPDEPELNIAPQTLARISELLTTNDPPREHELALIRPVAQKTAARLASLDAEISRLWDQRAALAKSHAGIILSPLRRMPPEILGEIFSWSAPFLGVPNIKDAPWVLTHVSRRWRAIAISKSSLWSQINLVFSPETKYSLDMIRAQIERARTLKIEFCGCHDGDSGAQVDMLQLLLEHASTWEEVNLELTAAITALMTAFRGCFTVLQKAAVRWDGPESQAGVESIDFFWRAASLVDITVFSEYRYIPTLLPVHHQLTRYDFDAPWTTHCELLGSLPNLREVRICRDFDSISPWPERREPIPLLHLRRLYVNDSEILDNLRAPALEALAILEDAQAFRHLESFMARSSCLPRALCIAGLPDVKSTMIFLQQHPSITELAILISDTERTDQDTERGLLSDFLTHLTVSNLSGRLPHITKLGFGCENAQAIPYTLYLDMLDSRWTAKDCALQAAELLLGNAVAQPDPESLARMATLRQAGMQVSFLSGEHAEDRADEWLHMPFRE